MDYGSFPPRRPKHFLAPLLRLLDAAGLLGLALRLAAGWRLVRGPGRRPRFPYVARARERSYQILLFHRVNDEGDPYFGGVPVATFREQMALIARHWTVLPLCELVHLARAGALPSRAAAITFDDGYRDNYEHAYPILAEHRLPATVFLATGAIDTGRPLWHDRVFDAFRRSRAPHLRWASVDAPMQTPRQRQAALRAVLRDLRARTPEERERGIRDALSALLLDENEELGKSMLTWAQIAEMRAGRIDFGAHTVSHPILTKMPHDAAMREILDSRDAIERRLSAPVDVFAYPNGTADDFDDRIRDGLRREKFVAAVTTMWGTNDASTDPFALRRVGLWDSDPRWSALRLGWYRLAG